MSNKDNDVQNLTGRILLSTATVFKEYMSKSMVLICEHSKEGAMGLIINRIVPEMSTILSAMDFGSEDKPMDIHVGGDKNMDKCFILHTNEYSIENSKRVSNNVFLTVSNDIIKSVNFVSNEPERKILCVGCCMWEASQLENEVASNYWIPIVADEALIFGSPHVDKWSKAFLKIGLHSVLFLDRSGTA